MAGNVTSSAGDLTRIFVRFQEIARVSSILQLAARWNATPGGSAREALSKAAETLLALSALSPGELAELRTSLRALLGSSAAVFPGGA